MNFKGQNILLVSNEPWGDIWLSKHHLAISLSRNNFVYFINSPLPWQFGNLFTNQLKETKINDSLSVLNYQNFVPLTGKSDLLFNLNHLLVSRMIRKFLRRKNRSEFIFISFDPIRLIQPKTLQPKLSIYYCVDNHIHVEREKLLAQNSDFVFAVSPMLVEKLRLYNPNIHLIPHGVQENNLSSDLILNHPCKKEIVYIGSVNYRLNYELLYQAALQLPDYTFKIIGKYDPSLFIESDFAAYGKCKNTKNIVFIDGLPYSELQPHLLDAELCISFYKQDYISNMLNSLKILQYLTYGKPVVSNFFEAFKAVDNDIIYMCKDGEFVSTLKSILQSADNKVLKRKRIEYAEQFTYSNIIRNIETIVNHKIK